SALSLPPPRASAAAAWFLTGKFAPAAEERMEEIREGIGIAEHFPHLVFRHRPKSAARSAAAVVDIPAALRAAAGRGACLLVHPPVRPELVVLLALRRIAQDLVRFVDFLELRLGGLVAWIDVGMVLARQLAERLLDFLLRRRLRDAERRVVVLEVHRLIRTQ